MLYENPSMGHCSQYVHLVSYDKKKSSYRMLTKNVLFVLIK